MRRINKISNSIYHLLGLRKVTNLLGANSMGKRLPLLKEINPSNHSKSLALLVFFFLELLEKG
jgi:hypothetical protein